MAPPQQHHYPSNTNNNNANPNPLFFHLDPLYCEEEHLEEEDEEEEEEEGLQNGHERDEESSNNNPCLVLLEQDLFWEDEELVSLLSKEEENHDIQELINNLKLDLNLSKARCEAVDWMMRVNAHYAFSPLTAVLSVNFLDRFLSSLHFQKDKPWMTQLVAVACISIAAKVEETQVPLLLDLQVEETKYVFEAKTIQRMELLILSTLGWKMNPVTPLSFLDHIVRRLGLKTHQHWEFMRRCERLLLSAIADSRFLCYLPSVLAAATMLHVINHVELSNPIEYQNQLMGVLKINKEKVDECYQLILESTSSSSTCSNSSSLYQMNKNKRKYHQSTPGSPSGVIDASFSSDSSNDSWVVAASSSSPPKHPFKKSRTQDLQQLHLPPFSRVAVDVLTSPR